MLSRDYWGRGLMTEAVKAVIEYGFDTLGIEVFTIGHFFENDRSRRVIEKCGFRYENDGEYYAEQLGRVFPERRYILLRGELYVLRDFLISRLGSLLKHISPQF